MPSLDHLVYAVPDLDEAVQDLTSRLGVRPSPGGRHIGRGTRNALLSLGHGSYLEIISRDPDGPSPSVPRPFGIDRLRLPMLAAWAVKAHDIEERVRAARAAGYDPGPVGAMSREAPDGTVLRWKLTSPPGTVLPSLIPFLIDWGDTPHLSTTASQGVGLQDFHGETPDLQTVRTALDALGIPLNLDVAVRPALMATLRGPAGAITLT